MTKLYTPQDRKEVLELIVCHAKLDNHIDGCILVGSGAVGFTDQFSDIDIVMVLNDKMNVRDISEDWKEKVQSLLPVFSHVLSIRAEDVFLHNFLLNHYLEINMCFLKNCDLEARKSRWKVLFDNTNSLDQKMVESWAKKQTADNFKNYYQDRIDAIWHYIMHVFVAFKRKRYWQAISDIEEIRNQTITLHGLRKGFETKRNREVDMMERGFLSGLEGTLVPKIEEATIKKAIGKVIDCFFEEALAAECELDLDTAKPVKEKMTALLSIL